MKKTGGIKIPASALLIILGVVLIIFRNAAPETILRILAVGVIIVGAAGIFQVVRDKESKTSSRLGRGIVQVILIVLGIAILIKTSFFAAFVKYVLGGIMLLFGIKDMVPAIKNKQGWLKIILSAVAIILGLYLIFFPPESMIMVAGLSLVYCGIISFLNGSQKSQEPKK